MTLPEETAPQDILPADMHEAVNGTYRTTVLELCLYQPKWCMWFQVPNHASLAPRSIAGLRSGAPQRIPSQHEANMAHSWGSRVSPERVRVDTVSAQTHFALLKDAPSHAVLPERASLWWIRWRRHRCFYQHVRDFSLTRYVQA